MATVTALPMNTAMQATTAIIGEVISLTIRSNKRAILLIALFNNLVKNYSYGFLNDHQPETRNRINMFRLSLVSTFVLGFTACLLGQTPILTPEQQQTKPFGSSLEKNRDGKTKEPQRKRSNDSDTIQVKTDLVVNDVLVTDQKGNIVTGLVKEDFIVAEDNIAQTTEMFSFGGKASPRSIVLIIDISGVQFSYLSNNIEAAKNFVEKLNPDDRLAIVTGRLQLLTDFSKDKEAIRKVLDSLGRAASKTVTGSWEFTDLLAVLNETFPEEDRNRIVVLQAGGNQVFRVRPDGADLCRLFDSIISFRCSALDRNNIQFADLDEAIVNSRATIYSIIPGVRMLGLDKKEQAKRAKRSVEDLTTTGLGTGHKVEARSYLEYHGDLEIERLETQQGIMSRVATLSGGDTSFLEKSEDADGIYSNVLNTINNRYSIGYYPTNEKFDGKRRTVKIEVRNHPEYKVSGRKTYIPREPQ